MVEKKAVAKPQKETGLASFENREPVEGMEGFDPQDLVVPLIKLIHPSSEIDKGESGQFYNSTTEEVMDSVELIFVTFRREEKAFEDPKTKEMKEPKPQYTFLCLDPNNKMFPTKIIARGTSFFAARLMVNNFLQKGEPLYNQLIRVGSVKKTGKWGTYYAMTFEIVNETGLAIRQNASAFYKKFGKAMIQSNEEEDKKEGAVVDEEDLGDVPA